MNDSETNEDFVVIIDPTLAMDRKMDREKQQDFVNLPFIECGASNECRPRYQSKIRFSEMSENFQTAIEPALLEILT